MALKEEIFDQNTTLFAVLDENEVTEIKSIQSSVIAVKTQLDQQKLQLDGLAKVVDNNQARNEEQFVNINTTLVEMSSEVDKLTTTTSQQAKQINTLATALNELDQTTKDSLNTLNTTTESLKKQVLFNTDEITVLKVDVATVTQKQQDVEHSLVTMKDEIGELHVSVNANANSIEALRTRIAALEIRDVGPWVLKNRIYKFVINMPSGTTRYTTIYFFTDVYYSTGVRAAPTNSGTATNILTITSLTTSYSLANVPVLKGVPYRVNGYFANGNSIEDITGSTSVIYDSM
uniref:Gp3 n=1 Tax=Nora virus TaxID=3071212 RepID=A0A0F7LWP2_NORAV|nr:gp3 [Drosophila melanogaster Nora virus]